MSHGGGRSSAPRSLILVALAIAGAALVAPLAGPILAASAREATLDDESVDFEDVDELTAPESPSRRTRAVPSRPDSAPGAPAPPPSRRATRRVAPVGHPPRLTLLLCRFLC